MFLLTHRLYCSEIHGAGRTSFDHDILGHGPVTQSLLLFNPIYFHQVPQGMWGTMAIAYLVKGLQYMHEGLRLIPSSRKKPGHHSIHIPVLGRDKPLSGAC